MNKNLIDRFKKHLGVDGQRKGVDYCTVYDDEWTEIIKIIKATSDNKPIEVGEYSIRSFPPIPGKNGSKYNIFIQNGEGEGTSVDLDWLWKNTF